MHHLMPRKPVPSLEFDTLGGGRWSLAAQKPKNLAKLRMVTRERSPCLKMLLSKLSED